MTQRRVSVCWRVVLVAMLSILAACDRSDPSQSDAHSDRPAAEVTAAQSYRQGFWTPSIRGTLDPENPNELSGTKAETKENRDGSVLNEHVTWEWRRR